VVKAPDDGAAKLGLDAGGTATRWCLLDRSGTVLGRGEAAGLSAAWFGTLQQPALDAALASIAAALPARPDRVVGGLTGFDGTLADAPGALHGHVARAFALDAGAVALVSDIELACRAAFAPGQGIVVIAGTGSIAAHLRAEGRLERAGGRGSLIDDGGGGYWIAREALRTVWRREDEAPGAWRDSALARELFAALGGAEWSRTREFVAAATRGQMGALATAVAAAARAGDADAAAILDAAGRELARIARALVARCGAMPVAVAGGVLALDQRILVSMRSALQGPCEPLHYDGALVAARLASPR
jgi:glucosamine kinase